MKEYIKDILENGYFYAFENETVTGMEESMIVAVEKDTNYIIEGFGRDDLSITIEKNNNIFTVLLWRNNEDLVKIYNCRNIGSLPKFIFDEVIGDLIDKYFENKGE